MIQGGYRPKNSINVGPNERKASLLSGSALVLLALTRPSKATFALALTGGYMIYRGATGNCLAYEALGINRVGSKGQGGVRITRAMTINRPRAEVYAFWRQFENLPQFMQHLERVESLGENRWHWVAKAPFDQQVEWDAEVYEERENELIAWRSLPGSQIENSGLVRFQDAPGGEATEVLVALKYSPPFGSASAALARLLGEEPEVQVREDLRRFKALMEAGEIPTTSGQTSGRWEQTQEERQELSHRRHKDSVQEASEQSFPASDPPAWTSSTSSS